jgi:hypothetical protein
MEGPTEIASPIVKENTLPPDIKFLEEMERDHPEIARDIRSRLPEWSRVVDEKSGMPGFAQEVLGHMEYISEADVELFVDSVASEVKQIKEKDPDKPICFVSWTTDGGSGKWFYDKVIDRLKDIDTNNITLLASHDIVTSKNSFQFSSTYFYLDDAANSGQQLQLGINAFDVMLRDDSIDRQVIAKNPIDVRIRLMRVTDHVVNNIINRPRKFFADDSGRKLLNIDTEGNPLANIHMPTMDDVSKNLGIPVEQILNKGLFFYGHHGRSPASLGVFWHRAQDNMPVAIIEGRLSNLIPPLITEGNSNRIKTQYVSQA